MEKLAACAALLVAALALASCELAPNHPQSNLVISPEGAITLEGKPVAENDLPRALRAIRDRAPGTELLVRTDRSNNAKPAPPNYEKVSKIVSEAGLWSTYTGLEEHERARKRKGLLGDALFIAAIVFPAMVIGLVFALRAATPAAARRRGFLVTVIAGLVIAVGWGIVYDTYNFSRFRGTGGWAWGFGIVIAVVYSGLWTLLAGTVAGYVAALWRRLRPLPARDTSPGS